jgi:hypothetical protein
MIKEMRQALKRKGYTAEETKLLLKSLTGLLDKLRKEAKAVATSTVAAKTLLSVRCGLPTAPQTK